MEGEKGLVCVTVGTGSIASWLIMRLLQDGYKVQNTTGPEPSELSIGSINVEYWSGCRYSMQSHEPDSFRDAIQGELEGIEGKNSFISHPKSSWMRGSSSSMASMKCLMEQLEVAKRRVFSSSQ
ncbi:hypothetical protein RJ641_016947, partial [Dillenia turbinata]